MSNRKKLAVRIGIYILGLMLLAVSVVIAANANLGISPVNSLPYVISLVVKCPMSTCVTGVFCVYVLVQILLLGRAFKPVNLFQIAFSLLFGLFVDGAKWLIGGWRIPTYGGSLAMTALSILLIAVGVSLYVDVQLMPMPAEGLALAVAQKTKKPFHRIKIVLDCTFVGVGALLAFLFYGELLGVREGTVLAALLVGRVVGVLQKRIKPAVEKMCGLSRYDIAESVPEGGVNCDKEARFFRA